MNGWRRPQASAIVRDVADDRIGDGVDQQGQKDRKATRRVTGDD